MARNSHRNIARHGFYSADPEARIVRLDAFFASDQGHGVGADLGDHAVIDLARQQAQRQADDAALVRHHAFDRQMRLAGVGGAQYRRDIACLERRLGKHIAEGHGRLSYRTPGRPDHPVVAAIAPPEGPQVRHSRTACLQKLTP